MSTGDSSAQGELSHVIYHSAATEPMGTQALHALLEQARTKNTQLDITGMLLYSEGSFLQVVEGTRRNVDAVIDRIRQDPRHERMRIIYSEPIAQRAFGEWSMGFHHLDDNEVSDIEGFSDYLDHRQVLAKPDEGRARKLLAAFSRGRWRLPLSDGWAGVSRPALIGSEHANFSVAFQPIVDLIGRSIFAFEAQIFEPTTQSDADNRHHAAQQAAIARASTLGISTMLVLPFAAQSLVDRTAVSETLEKAAIAGLAPSDIIVEIVLDNSDVDTKALARSLRDDRKRGLRILLGHVGASRTGLELLEHLQPDAVSIDAALTNNVAERTFSQAVVRGIVGISRDLAINVVAKGVATSEEYTWLLDEGVTLCQGDLFAKPSTTVLPNPALPLA